MIADQIADRGADGPASLARTSRMQTVEGRSGGSGNAPTIKTEVRRYEVECRLDYLRNRGSIDRNQWAAGMKFRRAWYATRTGAIRISSYSDERTCDFRDPAEVAQVRATNIFMIAEAVRLLTADEYLALCAVAGEDEPIENVNGMRDRKRGDRLKAALSKLAVVWV